MNRRWNVLLGLLILLSAPASSFGQDEPKGGLIVTAPTAIGFIWHATDRVALRPDFNFSVTDTDSGSGLSTSSGSAVNVGVSVLFFVARHDDLGIYVSPRFTFGHSSSELESSTVPLNSEQSGDSWSVAGSIGGHYRLGRRFGVFGEAGLLFSDADSEGSSTLTNFESSASAFGLRSAVGVAVYF
jgi:hypothetical protein